MSKENSRWYKASDSERIGEFKCIKNYETKELELNSKKGIIYPVSDTHYGIIIVKTGAMKKFLPPGRCAIKKGDEITFRFPLEELNLWAKRLGIVKNRSAMIKRANEFGKVVVDAGSEDESDEVAPDQEDPSSDLPDLDDESSDSKNQLINS